MKSLHQETNLDRNVHLMVLINSFVFDADRKFNVAIRTNYLFIIPPQTKFGGYIGITLSVRPSMYLVSATPPKRLIGFL